MADATYIEPITWQTVAKIIEVEDSAGRAVVFNPCGRVQG
jgi:carbamoylphosphate synthase large subunit